MGTSFKCLSNEPKILERSNVRNNADEQVTDIKKRSRSLGTWIENNPIIILAVAALLTVASFHYAQQIEMESETETFVDEHSRLYQEFDHLFLDRFATDSIVVLVEGDDVTRPEVLEAMERLTDQMEDMKHVIGTQSIAKIVVDAEAQNTGVRQVPNHQQVKRLLESSNPDIVSAIMPDKGHTIISIDIPLYISNEELEELLPVTESAVTMADFPPGIDTFITGSITLQSSIQGEMSKNMGQLLAISAVLMVVALFLVFRHVKLPLLPLPIVFLGIIWTFGMMGLLHVPLTMVSMAAFPILIGLGIDYAIQFHNRIEEEFMRGDSAAEAVIETITHTAPAVLVALIITGAGFCSLFTSSVPMIQDFGLLCLIGIIMCYLSALFVGVTVLYQVEKRRSILNEKNGSVTERKDSAIAPSIEKLADFSVRRWRAVLATALVLSIVGMYADSNVAIETDFKEFIPQDLPPLLQFKHLQDIFGGTDKINVIVQADDVTDPLMLTWMDDFASYLTESRDQVYGALSIATFVKMNNGGEIPEEKTEVIAILDSMPDYVKDQYLNGHDTALIDVDIGEAFDDLGQVGIKRLIGEVDKDILWFSPPPDASITQTGELMLMNSVVDALTTGRMRMTLLGLVLIFCILLLIYRDVIKAALPVLPMIVVVGWMGGVMYLTNMVYTPLTATLGALILGVGSEYAVLTMERFYEEMEKAADPMEALRTAVRRIGAAIIASGLTTVFGFSALMASPFPIVSNFGTITVLSVIAALFTTFTIFPVLIIQLEMWRAKRAKAKINIINVRRTTN